MNQFRDIPYLKINWKANNHVDASGAQDYVIEHLLPGQFPILSHTSMQRLWGALTFEDICRVIKKNRGIYEILKPDLKRKVYFDVDKSTLSLNEVKEIILKCFPNARMHISGREGSWHIVLSNYFAKNLESTLNTLRPFAQEHGFDKSVYTKNRNFKCINQSKRGEPVQKYVEGSRVLSKHLVLHDFDDDAIDIDTIDFGYADKETKAKTARERTSLDVLSIPQHDLPVPDHYDCLHAKPLEELALLPNPPRSSKETAIMDHQVSWQVMLWCRDAGLSFDEFWAWCRRKDSSAPRYKKYLQTWNNSDKYNVSRGFMDALLQRFYPDINMSPSTQRFQRQFDIMNTKYVTITNERYLQYSDISQPTNRKRKHEDVEYPLDRYFKRTVPPTGRRHAIKFSILAPPMGRNKTGAVVDFIARYGKEWRSLWLTPRITLSENTMWRLRSMGLDVDNYKHFSTTEKEEGRLDECQFLVCSINSLHYTTKPFDLVVIDEPETVFASFTGNAVTHKSNLNKNWNVLLGHIQTAQKVILMDAFTTNLSINFVKGIIQQYDPHIADHYEVVTTKEPASPRQFLEMETFDAWMTHIMQCAERGEKMYIYTPYKNGDKGVATVAKTLQKLMGWEDNKHIFAYYAEKDQEKKLLCDAEKIWGNDDCRCVVTNGTISVGVNFNAEGVFDTIYGFYAPFIPVRDFLQALYRVRHPKSTALILYREKTRTFGFERKPVNHPDCDIYRQLQKDLQIELNANDNTKNWETFNMMCGIANITIYPIQISMSHVDNQRYLDHYAKMCELEFSWDKIKDIDSDTAKTLQVKTYNTTATLDDRLQLEKFFFKTKFDPSAPEDQMADVWSKKKDFIDKILELKGRWDDFQEGATNGDLIVQVFKDNKLQPGDEFPSRMVNKLPIERIREKFHFDRPIQNSQSGVVAQMLNAFFGMKVYYCKKTQKMQKGERHYEYATNKLYLDLCEICLEHCRYMETVAPEDINPRTC
ncbi:hypothetical protein HK104_008889 [Borealophlyctis nickersoniae]|nr:hypothetical protein HK104_008889 [Borealophlyctis nickersoniae]